MGHYLYFSSSDSYITTFQGIVQPFIDADAAYLGLAPGSIVAIGNSEGDTVFRLKEGIERFLITDINNPAGSAQAQSTNAIMWDHVEGGKSDLPERNERFTHIPGGSNVLYLDGHVSFVKYPGDHPVSQLNAIMGAGV